MADFLECRQSLMPKWKYGQRFDSAKHFLIVRLQCALPILPSAQKYQKYVFGRESWSKRRRTLPAFPGVGVLAAWEHVNNWKVLPCERMTSQRTFPFPFPENCISGWWDHEFSFQSMFTWHRNLIHEHEKAHLLPLARQGSMLFASTLAMHMGLSENCAYMCIPPNGTFHRENDDYPIFRQTHLK